MKIIYTIIFTCLMLTACTNQPIKATNPSGPFVEISANQKIYIEVIIENDKVVQLKPVADLLNPEITMTFEFSELPNGMMLSVSNPLSKAVKYNIEMIDYKGKPHKTTSCAVRPEISVFESWPHPIPKLVVKNFRLLSNEDEITCDY